MLSPFEELHKAEMERCGFVSFLCRQRWVPSKYNNPQELKAWRNEREGNDKGHGLFILPSDAVDLPWHM